MENDCTSSGQPLLRVLLFTPHPAVGGGVVTFAQVLAKHLKSEFFVEQFVIGKRPGRIAPIWLLLVPIFDAVRLAKILLTQHHDIYHINPSFNQRAIVRDGLFLIILRLFRCRNILVFIHGWNEAYFLKIKSSKLRNWLFNSIFSYANRYFVLSPDFLEKLITLGLNNKKISILTTMFDGDLFRGLARNKHDKNVQILFLARLVRAKGIFELLIAFQSISKENLASSLIVAGDGPELENARTWTKTHGMENRIFFPGYIHGKEKGQLLLNSDIFVLPSQSEGCPIALLEAMAAGLPIVATAVGGIPSIVKDGLNGVLLFDFKPSSIRSALSRLIEDQAARCKIGETNRKEAWERFEARALAGTLSYEYQILVRTKVDVPPG